jgi:two-component system nitrogen regulation response regulator NtrX
MKTAEIKKPKPVQIEEINTAASVSLPFLDQPLREARDDFERIYFQHHMKDAVNNMSKLADIAGLERTHLYRKLKQLGIKIK